ncbi:MAG: acetyl-CoA carboxylase carboxyltransferase subunit alpha [Alphaproteobacteria bacterium]|nr:acetyl-CoA carboxylase carboxyltransferase subunit alpha [Alphaproteobacteria bacterium]
MQSFLDFEKPIAELEAKVEELRGMATNGAVDIGDDVAKLESKAQRLLEETYAKLTPWQKCQVARHPERPRFKDYVAGLVEDWQPLAGDRAFADDKAIQAGLGRFRGRSVLVLGQERGFDTASRVKHNFGMARPEGYRKAQRLMRLAERFELPVLTLVDTAGAYPGVDAEARGQAEAIAASIAVGLDLRVPVIATVIGEGGSGGAIAIAAADIVLMLEHATYSVISPEGCASILWRTSSEAPTAAEALRLTAQDLLQLGVIDGIVPERVGGAHRHRSATIAAAGEAIGEALDGLAARGGEELRRGRRQKFLSMGKRGLS